MRDELRMTFSLFFVLPPSHHTPLCPQLNLSSIPLVCLLFSCSVSWLLFELLFHSFRSVFFALFHRPVVRRPIFHADSFLSVSSFFCFPFFLLLYFCPTSLCSISILPLQDFSWITLPNNAQTSGLGGITGWIVCGCLSCLNWPHETTRVKGGHTAQRTPGPLLLIKTVD